MRQTYAPSIHKLPLNDLESVLEIENNSFAYPKSREILMPDIIAGKYYGTKKDRALIGYIGFEEILDEIHILNLAVAERFRRQGIAKELLGFVLGKGKKFYLEVRAGNQPAQKLYESFGFKVINRRKKYYAPNQEDALGMSKGRS